MSDQEREALNSEWLMLQEKLKGDFVNPKDLKRSEEITSLLMTNGESANVKFNFIKGRGYNKGLNATKPYNRKGKVG